MDLREALLEDFIVQFPNTLTDEECDECIEWFWNNENLHQDGRTYGYDDTGDRRNVVDKNVKSNTQVHPRPEHSVSRFCEKIMQKYKKYCEIRPYPLGQPMCLTAFSIRIYYQNNGWFIEHQDQGQGPNSQRQFGIVLYLNDVEEGGMTYFNELAVGIKAEKGKMLIFPANYLFRHEGQKPISGDKYAITAFMNFTPYQTST